jgi:hypothetical protein
VKGTLRERVRRREEKRRNRNIEDEENRIYHREGLK